MKKLSVFLTGIVALVLISITQVRAQESEPESKFSAGADFYSNYVWRGSKLGIGPSFQPSVTFNTGGLTVGVWGAFDASGYTEVDPYISYSFPFGLSLGVTDYYSPDFMLFEKSTDTTGAHAVEINAGLSLGGFSLSANYIVNDAASLGVAGGDMYFQAGYDFKNLSIFVGAGDGWYTTDGEFNICNIGLGTSKEIKITDSFSVPVKGQVVLNPEREALYLVVGFSL